MPTKRQSRIKKNIFLKKVKKKKIAHSNNVLEIVYY